MDLQKTVGCIPMKVFQVVEHFILHPKAELYIPADGNGENSGRMTALIPPVLKKRKYIAITEAMDKELKSGYRKYTFSEDGIFLKSEVAEGNTAWTLYKDWEIYGNYICIRNLSNENVLVKQDKLSAEERTWLIDLLTRHLGKAVNEK